MSTTGQNSYQLLRRTVYAISLRIVKGGGGGGEFLLQAVLNIPYYQFQKLSQMRDVLGSQGDEFQNYDRFECDAV